MQLQHANIEEADISTDQVASLQCQGCLYLIERYTHSTSMESWHWLNPNEDQEFEYFYSDGILFSAIAILDPAQLLPESRNLAMLSV